MSYQSRLQDNTIDNSKINKQEKYHKCFEQKFWTGKHLINYFHDLEQSLTFMGMIVYQPAELVSRLYKTQYADSHIWQRGSLGNKPNVRNYNEEIRRIKEKEEE